MNISRATMSFSLFPKIRSICELFLWPPKAWKPPTRCDILFFDASGIEEFTPYFKGYSITVLPTRGERVNIYVLFMSLFNKNFYAGKLLTAYLETFTKLCKPKLVITFIDNNPYFFSISTSCNVATMFVQNAVRSKNDIFELADLKSEKKNRVDYMFVFADGTGEDYKKILSGQIIVIGSFRNNSFVSRQKIIDATVVFISQWVETDCDNSLYVTGKDFKRRAAEEFYGGASSFVLPLVRKWCEARGKSLKVVGRNVNKPLEERKFFDSILPTDSYTFLPAAAFPSTYELSDSAEIVVFLDSTLGYESLARGKRVACFTCRGSNSGRGFCFDAFPDNGSFWTNSRDAMEVIRVLDYVYTVSDKEWSEKLNMYMPTIMHYDPGNSRFTALLEDALSKSAKEPPKNSHDYRT